MNSRRQVVSTTDYAYSGIIAGHVVNGLMTLPNVPRAFGLGVRMLFRAIHHKHKTPIEVMEHNNQIVWRRL